MSEFSGTEKVLYVIPHTKQPNGSWWKEALSAYAMIFSFLYFPFKLFLRPSSHCVYGNSDPLILGFARLTTVVMRSQGHPLESDTWSPSRECFHFRTVMFVFICSPQVPRCCCFLFCFPSDKAMANISASHHQIMDLFHFRWLTVEGRSLRMINQKHLSWCRTYLEQRISRVSFARSDK